MHWSKGSVRGTMVKMRHTTRYHGEESWHGCYPIVRWKFLLLAFLLAMAHGGFKDAVMDLDEALRML